MATIVTTLEAMFDEPEIFVFKPAVNGDWHAAREQRREETKRRYAGLLATHLLVEGTDAEQVDGLASSILDTLFLHKPVEGGDRDCGCSCHPRLPEGDLHDAGFECACTLTAEQRKANTSAWLDGMDDFWASPEGLALTAERAAEEDRLVAWLVGHPDVIVTSHGGWAPEQWRGSVSGHSFYFRERHDSWRIEVDLRPSGNFHRVWTGGDLDDDESFELREAKEGDVIAEGTTGVAGYGDDPVGRIEFISRAIRDHIAREECDSHIGALVDLEQALGRRARWCPDCGVRLRS